MVSSSIIGVALARDNFPVSLSGCAVSSVVEHFLDTEGVRGSNPLSRTIFQCRLRNRVESCRRTTDGKASRYAALRSTLAGQNKSRVR